MPMRNDLGGRGATRLKTAAAARVRARPNLRYEWKASITMAAATSATKPANRSIARVDRLISPKRDGASRRL